MKKYLILLLVSLLIFSSYSQAFVIWPNDSAPCDTTLQACIDASPEDEYIEIQTDDLINENIFTNKLVSLVAGVGYQPRFSAGRNIQLNSNTSGSHTVTIKGLTLVQGKIFFNIIGSGNIFNAFNNTILNNFNNDPGIQINIGSSANITINVKYNYVDVITNGTFINPFGAILITKSSKLTGTVDGDIYGNTITSIGAESKGISLIDGSDGTFDFNITGNVIKGATFGGIYADRTTGSGNFNLDISSNSFYASDSIYKPSGIHIINQSGTTDVDIINNTMISSIKGIHLREDSGTLTADVHNNLLAYNTIGFDFLNGVSVSNDYNLYYSNNLDTNFIPGPNSINSSPKLMGLTNPRLQKGSPAENAGNTLALVFVADAPYVDADGLYRVKREGTGAAIVDIGAYERGDVYFNHVHSNTGTPDVSTINNAAIDGLPNLNDLHITPNFNPRTGIIGVANNSNDGIFYQSGHWSIFNQDQAIINNGASFNVIKYGSTTNTIQQSVAANGMNSVAIDNSGLNGNPNRILQVTQLLTGVFNDHPPGVFHSDDKWRITNMDQVDMVQGLNFNISYQIPSKSAWEHIVSEHNSNSSLTFINNPLINNRQCAQIQMTQSASQGVFNASPVGLIYFDDISKWAIYNVDNTNMLMNSAFHLTVNPEQVSMCDTIFINDFE